MHTKAALAVAAAAAVVLLASVASSFGTGVWAGLQSPSGNAPNDLNRALPSCGQCHRVSPGGLSLRVRVTPSAHALTPNEAISITTTATGGQTASTWGGFSSDATAGTFSPGSNSQVNPQATSATHLFAQLSNNRSWTYGYTAPATPGPVDVFTTVNTVNGDGRESSLDFWAFHGWNSSDIVPTPVRLYVNAQGVVPFGSACTGSYDNVPVLGAKVVPAPGSAFAFELVGAAPSAQATLVLGFNANWQAVDLTVIGAPGCTLLVDPKLAFAATTTAGTATHGDGTAAFPLPIPNDPTLRGLQLQAQAVIVDPAAARALPVTLTQALRVTVQ